MPMFRVTRFKWRMLWPSCIRISEARIDAADVEFALGGASVFTLEPPPAVTELTNMKGSSSTDVAAVQPNASGSHMWLLDFNECQPVYMDHQGVDQEQALL